MQYTTMRSNENQDAALTMGRSQRSREGRHAKRSASKNRALCIMVLLTAALDGLISLIQERAVSGPVCGGGMPSSPVTCFTLHGGVAGRKAKLTGEIGGSVDG